MTEDKQIEILEKSVKLIDEIPEDVRFLYVSELTKYVLQIKEIREVLKLTEDKQYVSGLLREELQNKISNVKYLPRLTKTFLKNTEKN